MRNALLIKPRVSLFLCLFFCVIYTMSFLLLAWASMAIWLHFLLSAFVLLHFIYVMRRYVFYRHPLSVKRLWCDEHDDWKIQYSDAHVRTAKLLQSVMVSRYLIFLAFRLPGRLLPVTVPLALDSDESDNIRRLRQVVLD